MPSRSSKDHDFMTVARRVVEQAIGERLDGAPLALRSPSPEARTEVGDLEEHTEGAPARAHVMR